MRKQEFNSKLISLLPLDEVPVHVPLRRPRPLRFERLRVSVESIQPRPPRPCEVGRPKGRRRKSRRQSHKFFKHRRSGCDSPHEGGQLASPRPAHRRNFKACFLEVTSYWRVEGDLIAVSFPRPPCP